MKSIILACAILLTSYTYVVAQSAEHYEVIGAKVGKKMNRQMRQANRARKVTTERTEGIAGWGHGEERGNHRYTSFVGAMDGAVIGTMAHSYKYQNYYHGDRQFNYRKQLKNSSDISALEIVNITYADDNEDGKLTKDESAQLYFDMINTGDTPLYGITPVLLANKTKHIIISETNSIDTLQAKSAIRYVVELGGDGKSNPGKVYLLLRLRYGQGQYKDIQEITLTGRKE